MAASFFDIARGLPTSLQMSAVGPEYDPQMIIVLELVKEWMIIVLEFGKEVDDHFNA
ncbi:hypothetical protein F2Q69_00012100 [Brassica cretica]|uniref:Uncharacterized protein n=1 Tax=Brassica cretica TaxID=69181 RepID=A0A8S9QY40_BRACR|nr:hypothetical protein F2Q69_00012100 [Brassica cretica]